MLNNYLKTAFRNLIKKKSFAFISIVGMAIGLAVCVLLLLYVQNELSYDRFNKQADHIYRLCQAEHPFQAPQTAKLLADNLPEIKDYARILVTGEGIVDYQNKRFKQKNIALADASLFRIFSFRFKSGIPADALLKPFTMVISEDTARAYFGNEDPIGKVLKLDNAYDYTIAGVMENMPQNSHFRYDMILTLADADKMFGSDWMNNWGWQNFLVYFLMPDRFSRPAFEKKCTQIVLAHRQLEPGEPKPNYALQNLKDIHLYSSNFKSDIQPQNSITYVLIFSAIGFLILLIACFNYINILTANATTRSKEIGIRKVVGASRKDLSLQFFGESFLIISIALLLALLLVILCLPIFNGLSGKLLALNNLLQGDIFLSILGMVVITATLAGFYPAMFLSAIQPVKTFKSSAKLGATRLNFRKFLVVAQFTIVVILISAAAFMFSQMHYLQNKKLGFDKEYVLTAEAQFNFKDVEKFNALKQALLQESAVKSVSCASRVPANDLNNMGSVIPPGKTEGILIPYVHVGQDYFEALGIKTVQGRLFSNDLKSDTTNSVILNEAAIKKIGLVGDPLGQRLACNWPDSKREIVGIVRDFHFESLHKQIQPTVFLINYAECSKLLIKVNPSNAGKTINKLQAICSEFYPDQIFEFQFLDTQIEGLYRSDNNTFHLLGYFTALAVFIACMGLFGLALFMMRGRTREIGIRKVFGASIMSILRSLTKDFTRWILAANAIALPVTFYGINTWLQNFAYRIDITIWPFLIAGLFTFLIAWLTVIWQAMRVATANPIDSLRYE
jgi:putative ABC transport system permease protein